MVSVCDGAPDWLTRTCNIIHNVKGGIIGRPGSAMHQATVYNRNPIQNFLEFCLLVVLKEIFWLRLLVLHHIGVHSL